MAPSPPPIPPPIQIPEPDAAAGGGAPKTRVSARGRLRTYFLTGIIVAGPLAITAYITWWFIALIDSFVKPLVPASYLPDHYLPFSIPGLGLVIAFLAVTLLGFLTANLVGRSVIEFGEVLLARTPVISGLYKGLRQIFETLFSANGTSFRTVGLVEFPVKGTWSVVFLSAPAGTRSRARCAPGGPPTNSSASSCPAPPIDHGLLLLPAPRRGGGTRHQRRRRRQAGDVGRGDPARGSAGAPLNAMAATLRTAQQAGGTVSRREPQDA